MKAQAFTHPKGCRGWGGGATVSQRLDCTPPVDPRSRPSARKALEHPYFLDLPSEVISERLTARVVRAHQKAMASAFAFEHQRLNMEDLRSMIRSEVRTAVWEGRGGAEMGRGGERREGAGGAERERRVE